jgi:hypothetical protein
MDMKTIQKMVDNDGIVFLSYGGFLSQPLITGMTEALEKEVEYNDIKMSVANNIFIVFIELSQNMMNYSKSSQSDEPRSRGLILVSKDKNNNYHIHSQNIVSKEDKEKIEPKLKEIKSMTKDELKKRYRELRKSGKNTHQKGGGIGFYEIAKKCDAIDYDFEPINEDKYYFHINSTIKGDK